MFKIQTLNNIAINGLKRLPLDQFEIASEMTHPDAVLVRSHKMHDWAIPDSLLAVGRAGAGVNNIPTEALSAKGIPVFNTPGENANAVQELVLSGLLLSARNICQAWDFARNLEGQDSDINKVVEAGKKEFVGFELPNKTLGVVGLGAIGIRIANTAVALGMRVIGYDPKMTVEAAWQLAHEVEKAASVEALLTQCDFVTFHVPLVDATRNLINKERLALMRENVSILNFARKGIVDDDAIIEGLNSGKVNAYVCDFPTNQLKKHPRVITLPHLGASTIEAEDNCATMVAEQIRDYLENGNITNSVNFPAIQVAKQPGQYRITVAHANVPNLLSSITSAIASDGVNILDLFNKSRHDVAYTLIDMEFQLSDKAFNEIQGIDGVMKVRCV